MTSVAGTAAMIARVALGRDVPPGKVAFAGDRASFRRAGEVVAWPVGRTLAPVSYGSLDDLRAAHAAALKADPARAAMLAYLLYVATGQTAPEDLQNDRYPDLKL